MFSCSCRGRRIDEVPNSTNAWTLYANFMKAIKLLGIFLIPIFSIIYAVGESNDWWNRLVGRQTIINSYQRLSNGHGYPINWIYDDESIFQPLKDYIEKRTSNP